MVVIELSTLFNYLIYERMVYQIQEGRCHPPLFTVITTHRAGYVARPVGLISNFSTSGKCDNGINRHSDNRLCMAKRVT